jgi:hypothetical protein
MTRGHVQTPTRNHDATLAAAEGALTAADRATTTGEGSQALDRVAEDLATVAASREDMPEPSRRRSSRKGEVDDESAPRANARSSQTVAPTEGTREPLDPTRIERPMRGDGQCRCGSCDRHFSTTRNFGRHQMLTEDGGVVCRHPRDCGLVVRWSGGRAWWSAPAPRVGTGSPFANRNRHLPDAK